MIWQRVRRYPSLLLICLILATVGIGEWSFSASAPDWLRMVGIEIQAACRDAGTQWMVVVCLVSYFVVFLFLEKRSKVQGSSCKTESESEAQNAKPPSAILHPLSSILSANYLLIAFVVLILMRYAFDYSNAARSLQVVVLLTGLVVGKGIGLWARAARSCKFQGSSSKLGEAASGDTSSGCATFSPSDAEKGIEAERESAPSSILHPRSSSRRLTILCIITFLLAVAALWQPERGMEFQYRGQRRWTGVWDNPNTYGVLMGVGTVLAVGMLVSRLKSQVSSRGMKREGEHSTPINRERALNIQHSTSNEVGHVTPCAPGNEKERHLTPALSPDEAERVSELPPINHQQSTIHYAQCLLLLCASALCAYGLIKSYSRGAWLGTAVGIGYLIWKWINRTHLTPNPHPQPLSQPLGEGGVGLSPRPTGGEGESFPRLSNSEPQLSTIHSQPSTGVPRPLWLPISVLLASVLVISFWQFRHTESPVLRRVFSVGNVNDFSWRNRVTAWQGAGRMMWDKPIIGFGWGKAEEIYSKDYRAARLEESAAVQLNDYLMIGISAGVPALVCLLAYLCLCCRRPRVESREPEGTTPHPGPLPERGGEGAELSTINNQLSTTAAAGVAVLLIGFWFDGGLFKLPTCVVFWVLLELARGGFLTTNHTNHTKMETESVPALPTINNPLSTINQLPALALRWLAGLFALAALGMTTLHLGTPQLAVSERTLNIARKFLVPPKEKIDFEYLAYKSIWSNTPLKTLLQHAHLANYNRTLVNWKLDDQLYREFVLSPEILVAADVSLLKQNAEEIRADSRRLLRDGGRESELSTIHSQLSTRHEWRRPLWEYFYPRIRKENSLEAAAEIIVRNLNETCRRRGNETNSTPHVGAYKSVLEIWQRQVASVEEFERIYVAALRSAGIPARLTASGQAEFWNGAEWKPAPRPVEVKGDKG